MAKGQKKVTENKDEILKEIPLACADELTAVEFMEKQRWGDSPACPRCGDCEIRKMEDRKGNRNKRFLWRCYGCKKQFTVRIGTVLEDSSIPLRIWCYAFWKACSSKKGVSALQIKRETGLSYKSALFLMHRIRFAMSPELGEPLKGDVECDETYVGGKPRYKGQSKRGRGTKKTPVFAMVERNGRVSTRVITDVTSKTLQGAIRECVDPSSRILTDENPSYNGIGYHFDRGHATVNHGRKEYVRGEIHSNTIESFFAILKRGVTGTFHSVSKKHLHRYLSEFEFRYNTRKLQDGERLTRAIKAADGKRLRYAEPIAV